MWVASPALRVVNRYGPTETTIAVAHLELTPELLDTGQVPMDILIRGALSTSLTSTEGWWIVLEWSASCTSAEHS